MNFLIVVGAQYVIVLIAVVLGAVVFFNKERRLEVVYVGLVALPLAYALARLAGMFISHPQPFAFMGFEPLIPHEVDNSFPSDHMLIGGVLSSLAFLADKRVGVALWALTCLVGISRMLAGLHWGVDILAAAAIAVASVSGVYMVRQRLMKRS